MLRPATDADRDAALRWRNHPQVRALSFGDHEIQPDEHAAWWQRTMADPEVGMYVYERGGVPSGVVRLDFRGDGEAGWNFYLDVDGLEERGQLFPAWIEIERDVLRLAFDELGLRSLGGEVLAHNESVRAMHQRHGFRESEPYVRTVDGVDHEVVHVEVTADTVRLPGRA